jgi:putative redox protein
MSEKIIVRQNNRFEIEVLAADEENGRNDFVNVTQLHEVTPYGMFLSSLGSCTAIVLHTYAQNHGLDLQEVELRLEYKRIFQDDCENCEVARPYEEGIEEEIALRGDLSAAQRDRLFKIAHQCPIHKMLQSGIEIRSHLAMTA